MNGTFVIAALSTVVVLLYTPVTCNVLDPGVVVSQGPSTIIAQKNSPLLLNCSATSAPEYGKITVKWFKNGELITTDKRVQMVENGSLYFQNVKRSKKRRNRNDEGFYECHLTNTAGTVIGRRVHLKVARLAKSFSSEPQDIETFVGGVTRFMCHIEAVPPSVMYVWEKDHAQLPLNNKFTMLPSGILQVYDVHEDDAGEYHCSAFHSFPSRNSHEPSVHRKVSRGARLTVNQAGRNRPPAIVSFSPNVTVKEGDTTILECLADGKPKPTIRWFRKDDSPVEYNVYKELVGEGNLKFTEVDKKDAGVYKCVASSPGFNDSIAIANLQVIEPPKLDEGPTNGKCSVAQTVRFQCQVSGSPKPKVTWYGNGKKIIQDGSVIISKSNELVITCRVGYSGYYQCVAENSGGSVIATARLKVTVTEDAPSPPEDVRAVAISPTEISVQWTPSVVPPCCPIKAYTVHYQKVDESTVQNMVAQVTNVTLVKLQPYTSYKIYVQGYNKPGASEESKVLTVTTHESVPSIAPLVQLSSTSPTSIHVNWTWDKKLEDKKNGVISRYKISYMNDGIVRSVEVYGNTSSYLITGLIPETEYKVRVLGATSVGYPNLPDSHWPWFTQQTLEPTAPISQPPNVTITCLNSTTVRLDWELNVNSSHRGITGYQILVRKIIGQGKNIIVAVNKSRNSYLLTSLEKKTFYEAVLMAENMNNVVSMGTERFQTDCGSDPQPPPPLDLDAMPISGTTINLKWKRPKSNQEIVYYTVRYHKMSNPGRVTYERSDTLSYMLEKLEPFKWYNISVRSHFSHMAGPFGNAVLVQTKEDLPSPPEHIRVTRLGNNGVLLVNWKPPASQSGTITYYIVMYNTEKDLPDSLWECKKVNGTQTSKVLEGLPPETVYYIKVKACNKVGESAASKIIKFDKCPFDCSGEYNKVTQLPVESTLKNQRLGIIIGCTVGLTSIIICIVVVFLRQRHYARMYGEHQIQNMNGPCTVIHRNGHIAQCPSNHNAVTPGSHGYDDSHAPMLTENANSDAKGPGPGVIFSANGKIIYFCSNKMQNGKMRALVAEPEFPNESQEHQALLSSDSRTLNGVARDHQAEDLNEDLSGNTSGSNVSLSCDPSICSRQDNQSHDNSPYFNRAKCERGYKFEDRQDSLEDDGQFVEENEENVLATSVSTDGPQDIGASGFPIKDSGIHGNCYHSDYLSGDNDDISHSLYPNQETLDNTSGDLLSKMLEATTVSTSDDSVSSTVSPLTSSDTSAASSSLPQSSVSRSPVAVVKKTSSTEASDQIV